MVILVNTLYNFCYTNPHFLEFYAWFLIGVTEGQERLVDKLE